MQLLSISRLCIITLYLLPSLVLANTEIRNFKVSHADDEETLAHERLHLDLNLDSDTDFGAGADSNWRGLGRLYTLYVGNERVFYGVPAELGTPLEDVCESGRGRGSGSGSVRKPEGLGDGDEDEDECVSVSERNGIRERMGRDFELEECPNEVWVKLDFDDDGGARGGDSAWARYTMFTLRLSWPANVRSFFSFYLSIFHAFTLFLIAFLLYSTLRTLISQYTPQQCFWTILDMEQL